MYEPSIPGGHPQPLMEPAQPVFDGLSAGPRYGETVWDFQALIYRESMKERCIDLGTVPDTYRESVRNTLVVLANPMLPVVVDAGVVHGTDPALATSVIAAFYRLRVITRWGGDQGLADFADWTQLDADKFLLALRAGQHGAAGAPLSATTVRRYVDQLKDVRRFSPVLPRGGFSFQPWGAMTANMVAQAQKLFENTTPPLPWETWAPTVAGAWAVVDKFSADILAADKAMSALPKEPRGPGGSNAWRIVQQWADDGGVLPLHTGVGRSPGARGEKNVRLLARMLRINDSIFNKANANYRPEANELFQEMSLDPERSALGGLVRPTVTVTHSDGTITPWISEIGLGETEYLVSVLRAACYVMLAALTGMRDSEIQSLTRDTATTLDGLPGLTGRQYKGVPEAEGKQRGWWAPDPIFRTTEVISSLSPHPVHLFARSATSVGAYDSARDIARLIEFINGDPETRVGRGKGHGLEPVYVTSRRSTSAITLRRSFSAYAVAKPAAELGLGIQLGHLSARTTTGYLSDGAQQLTQMMDNDRQSMLRDYASAIVLGAEAVAGPAGKRVQEMRAQIITDPRRAEQLTEQLAERLHLGVTNDCMYNAVMAACGPDGPSLGDHICAGSDCANSLYTTTHRKVLELHIERIGGHLDKGKGHKEFTEGLGKDRARTVALIREIAPEPEQQEEGEP